MSNFINQSSLVPIPSSLDQTPTLDQTPPLDQTSAPDQTPLIEKIKEIVLIIFRALMAVGGLIVGLPFFVSLIIPAVSIAILVEVVKAKIKYGDPSEEKIQGRVSKGLIEGLNVALAPIYLAFKAIGSIHSRVVQGLDYLSGNSTELRTDYPPEVRDFIKKYGHYQIDNIRVFRAPFKPGLKKLMDFLTCGQMDRAIEKAGYKKLWHTYMVIELGGMRVICEKNEVISISEYTEPEEPEEQHKGKLVPLKEPITFAEFLQKGERAQGKKFFLYSPFSNNCQNFINVLLTANQLNSRKIKKFALQNGKEISLHLKRCQRTMMRRAIYVAGMFDFLIKGR